ncbi:MAG: hypothetical protein J7M29_01450 [Verrucomicrobia bacterium]|nr:hypothetical protein [Verrucomicrobiota bacterium]
MIQALRIAAEAKPKPFQGHGRASHRDQALAPSNHDENPINRLKGHCREETVRVSRMRKRLEEGRMPNPEFPQPHHAALGVQDRQAMLLEAFSQQAHVCINEAACYPIAYPRPSLRNALEHAYLERALAAEA